MNDTDDAIDTVEAFADGEAVDPNRLMRALSEAPGRGHLIDLLVLRGFVGGPGFSGRAAEFPIAASPGRSRAQLLSLAAALVLVSALGGFVAGGRFASRASTGIAAITAGATAPTAPVVAPKPTRVIHLQNGVDWTEQSGGH